MSRRSTHQHSGTSWLAVLLGVWLLSAPFVLGYPRYYPLLRGTANDLALGTAVVTFALLSALRGDRAQGALRGLLLCGVWLLLSGPVLGLAGGPLKAAAFNDPITGTALLLVAMLALLLSGRGAPAHGEPELQRTQPVLWARPAAGLAPAAFRGQESDRQEERARRSIGWAYAAVGGLVAACVLLGLALVFSSVTLLVAGLLLGLGSGFTAVKVHVLADTTVGQAPRGA